MITDTTIIKQQEYITSRILPSAFILIDLLSGNIYTFNKETELLGSLIAKGVTFSYLVKKYSEENVEQQFYVVVDVKE